MKNSIRALLLILLLPTCAWAQSYTISPSPFLLAQNNSGAIINQACIWTYLAGTTTAATTYSDNAGTPNTNPIRSDSAGRFTAYLIAGTSYKYVYESACTPPAHGTVLRTADNIAGTPASAATVDVTVTAGETLSATNCAYISDGSGSKNAGQAYKCDQANAYSSTTPTVGLVPAAIASGATGTLRIAGSVTGLGGLSVGSPYYIGVSGAITATAPGLRRALGIADSSTSIVLKDIGVPTQPWVNDFRLTLTTATPVTTADVTGASAVTIFLSPYVGNRIDLPDASGNPQRVTTAEISIAVPATTSQMYDVFCYLNGSTATLELLAWTNDTTRATALVRTNGRLLKTGDLTRLYVGSVRTTTVSGQTEDSAAKRYVWNYYNRVRRALSVTDTTDSWTYTTAAFRQARASTANQLDVVIGVAEVMIEATVIGSFSNTNIGVNGSVAIGEDSTTTPIAGMLMSAASTYVAASGVITTATVRKAPAVGRHFYAWLEFSVATGTTSWVGDAGVTYLQTGMVGSIEG